MKWVLPAFLTLLVLGFLAKHGCNTGVDALDKATGAVTSSTEEVTNNTTEIISQVAGEEVALTGDAIKNVFDSVNDMGKAAWIKLNSLLDL